MPIICFLSYIIAEEYLWYPKAIFNIIYLYILFYCGDLNAVILVINYFSCPILNLHIQTNYFMHYISHSVNNVYCDQYSGFHLSFPF